VNNEPELAGEGVGKPVKDVPELGEGEAVGEVVTVGDLVTGTSDVLVAVGTAAGGV
jgi:hypothetical protein